MKRAKRAAACPRSLALVEQWVSPRIDAPGNAVEDPEHLRGERPGLLDAILRAPELRRRDHLHGLGDLLRRFHRADATADVQQ